MQLPRRPPNVPLMPKSLDTESPLVREASFDGGVLRISVEGEVDLRNSPTLRDDLLDLAKRHEPERVELDLAGVPYMDSSAIAVLVELLKAVRQGNGGKPAAAMDSSDGTEQSAVDYKVRLLNLQPRVAGLLHIARLDSIFDLQAVKGSAAADAAEAS